MEHENWQWADEILQNSQYANLNFDESEFVPELGHVYMTDTGATVCVRPDGSIITDGLSD